MRASRTAPAWREFCQDSVSTDGRKLRRARRFTSAPAIVVVCALDVVLWAAGCRRTAPPPPLVGQVSGRIEIDGLRSPVRVVRDRWGVPHIYAQSEEDLFVAQGFVQAEDRLFQMDLWRRSVQGRLAEVLGPNFIERDAMTRRVQYRGDLDTEWASYGPDARAIAAAFVRGINAWVALARQAPPEEFVLAGWKPAFWSPVDLLNRTDAFVSSGDAIEEVQRRQLSDVLADAIRRVGAPPFFAGVHVDASTQDSVARGVTAAFTHDGLLSFSEPRRELICPSARYFVHLQAPGWNVIGATAPWMPAVAIGHNDRISWGTRPIAVDTQDVYSVDSSDWTGRTGSTDGIDAASPGSGRNGTTVIRDAVVVKGRRSPFLFDTTITAHGVVIASDSEHHRAFALRWSGAAPGAAPELGSIAIGRARNWTEFRGALEHWKMPARRVVYADVEGHTGYQDVALVPRRTGNNAPSGPKRNSGLSRRSSESGSNRGGGRAAEQTSSEWRGWLALDELPHAFDTGTTSAGEPGSAARPVSAQARFVHVLAATDPARRRYGVGLLPRPADDAAVRATFDPSHWDRSTAMNAPGQSESPSSPHFSDLAAIWSSGRDVALAFSDEAVAANASATLQLVPRGR